ncbi:glyoxalase [Agriterribacter sp.]|uniref:glyoxalase n=1 Tax=Agriterribacter sp. TaxID=2821509 RepID=UPI002BD53F0A|nr:glyoxalase [Agriterribacter sp.]HRP55626.1 glyoxalase [Agriterribacter sp.]
MTNKVILAACDREIENPDADGHPDIHAIRLIGEGNIVVAEGTVKINAMEHRAVSIRPFIGAKNFEISRNFYRDLGFRETVLFHNMSLFKTEELGFYLQDAYVKDWIDNSMIFLEVRDVNRFWNELVALKLETRYEDVKLTPIRQYDWGSECFLHDPSGNLWHFGEFVK